MLSRYQQLLLVIGLCLSVARADVDCSKRPKFVEPKVCCPLPEFVTPELKEKCQEYKTTALAPPLPMSGEQDIEGRRPHHHHLPSPCFVSCVFNETGFYEDNKVDQDKLKEFLRLIYKDNDELQTLASDAFNSCASRIDEFKDKKGSRPPRPSPPPGAPLCPMRPAFLMRCVYRKILKDCPAPIWNDTQECNDAREYFDNCKPLNRRPSNDEN
ncbi:general odorant-binding protein 67 [Drosophila innubila]|uniref:general odorant-binding protein 67 n=1 Tax=Drosophila innubila TaxID=198719 RepID=UPI00148B62B2|nr:general odorant-binding protein 67 [Drosophila innubila]